MCAEQQLQAKFGSDLLWVAVVRECQLRGGVTASTSLQATELAQFTCLAEGDNAVSCCFQ